MRSCARCSRELADDFRFCPHCGAAQRSKVVEYFRGDPGIDDGALRVSVYLTERPHVRLSIWRDARAEAAMSLDPTEAHRLGEFLGAVTPRRDEPRSLGASLRRALGSIR
jgi:hypothetical protein